MTLEISIIPNKELQHSFEKWLTIQGHGIIKESAVGVKTFLVYIDSGKSSPQDIFKIVVVYISILNEIL